jgi:hypothetical protein
MVRGSITLAYEKWRAAMLTPEERALFTERQDRLIELYVEQKEATRAEDWVRLRVLQAEIDDANQQLDAIRVSAD